MHNGYLKTLKKRIPESEGEGEGKMVLFSNGLRYPLYSLLIECSPRNATIILLH